MGHVWKIRRWLKHWWQCRTRGWDDTELWNLDITIANFILPRLRMFKEHNDGHPPNMTMELWNEMLDEMIWSMEFNSSNSLFDANSNEEHVERANRGLALFWKYYNYLWI